MKHSFVVAGAAIGAAAVLGALVVAGPLDPPAGPVASTHKTLSEVEPRVAISAANTPGDADSLFKIVQPGSYYLTGSIAGSSGKHGIEIAASHVTLDLNGFDVAGFAGIGFVCGVTVSGVDISGVVVRNGVVRNWGGDAGVDLSGIFGSTNCRVEEVVASGNVNAGIKVGVGGQVVRCTAALNPGVGINALSGCAVLECTASNNSLSGIVVGTGCLVESCAARLNSLDGIRCAFENVIRGNVCSGNGNNAGSGAGVHATGGDNRIEGNNCTGADRGIDVDVAGSIIIRNTCAGNTTNWDIAANNVCGPILDRTAPASAAIIGNVGADSTGSTHPNANFTY